MFFIHDRTGLRVSLTGPDLEAYPWPPTVAIVSFAPKVGDSFRVFINAGCRPGEILAVTNNRGMVNFEGGHIKISRMIHKGRKKDVVTPLNNALTEALKKAIKISGVGRGERIFPYSVYFVDKKWGKIRKMVGLEDSVRVHDLRHTFESRTGRAAQDDPYDVQELMGHTDFGTTQKYIHLSESRNRTIMEKLDSSPIKIPTSEM